MLHEIAEVIGADAAVRLGQAMGGARIYVPHEFASDSPVTIVIGEEAAKKLSQRFSGDTLEIPSKRQFRKVRDAMIREDYATIRFQGCKANHLALKYGVSRRQVFNVVRGVSVKSSY